MENNAYTQLCVWPGTVLGDTTPEEFEAAMAEMFGGVRVQYHTEVLTLPDLDRDGLPDPATGGRNDLFFYVHSEDIPAFAIPRLKAGIRWWEDMVVYNDHRHLYSPEFLEQHLPVW
jgi:hypothetical protein